MFTYSFEVEPGSVKLRTGEEWTRIRLLTWVHVRVCVRFFETSDSDMGLEVPSIRNNIADYKNQKLTKIKNQIFFISPYFF